MSTPIQTSLLLLGRRNLLRMREDACLSDAEIATVDRGIAALDRLLAYDDSDWARIINRKEHV